MLKMLSYLIGEGVATVKRIPETLSAECSGLPSLSANECISKECRICQNLCPTDAITFDANDKSTSALTLDLGACIACGLCISNCPTGTITRDLSCMTARGNRENLILRSNAKSAPEHSSKLRAKGIFTKSIACRVVSTGCTACDLEIAACSNSVFDMDRFGISIVASPRFADVLLVTGPVPLAMHQSLKSCYLAMPEPRKVIAVGTCACSGGLHRGGYASANGAPDVIPVDAFIPGCPPHPWSIIEGIRAVMTDSL